MSSTTRKEIMAWFLIDGNETITTAQANTLSAGNYFYNGRKHVQESLSRLVKSGDLVRIARGVYRKGTENGSKYEPPPDNQLELF